MPKRFQYPLNGHLNPPVAVNRVLNAVAAYGKENEQFGLKYYWNNKRAGYRNIKFWNVWPEDVQILKNICDDNGVTYMVEPHYNFSGMGPSFYIPTQLEYKRNRDTGVQKEMVGGT